MTDIVELPSLRETSSPAPPVVSAKKHVLAAGLSALVPGWGQFRLGRTRQGTILLGSTLAFLLCFWPLRLPQAYPGITSLIVAGVALFNFAVLDALFSRDPNSKARLRIFWLPLGLIFGYLGLNVVFTAALISSGFRPVQCKASSMEPLLRMNDRFVYDWKYYASHPKLRGDVVVLRRENLLIVKRIVAIGGDTIEGQAQSIILNGNTLDEPYVQHNYPPGSNPAMDKFGPITLPAGKYFVMGDNRDISLDSRDFGPVSDDAVVGRALYFYKIGFRNGPPTRRLN